MYLIEILLENQRQATLFRKLIYLQLIFLCLFGSQSFSETIYEHIQKADELYSGKKFNRALFHYKNALSINPSSKKALLGYARCSKKLHSRKEAIEHFKKVLKLEPSNMESVAGIAELLSEEGNHKEALALADEAIKESPYNADLLVARVNIYLNMKDYRMALKKLEDAKGKVTNDSQFKLLYASANSMAGKFEQSETILKELIAQSPENPTLFLAMGKLKINKALNIYPYHPIDKLLEESKSNLLTSIALDPENEETRTYLTRVYVWLKEYDNALKHSNILLETRPGDNKLLYINAFLNREKVDNNKSTEKFEELIRINDLDEIARFSAEEFVIKNLSEKHKFRNELGKYRMLHNKIDSNDYLHGEANFNLHRAMDLVPDNNSLVKDFTEYYYRNGYLDRYIESLKKIRDREPDNIKIHNKLEKALRFRKNSLSYKEGFSTVYGETDTSVRSLPEIFIFDPVPKNFFKDHPDAPEIIGKSIKFAFKIKSRFKVVEGADEEAIRKEIMKHKTEYGNNNKVYYSPEIINSLDAERGRYKKIRYVGYGDYELNEDSLLLNFQLYDREEGKIIKKVRVLSTKRNYLSEVAVRLTEVLDPYIPVRGNVIKVNNNSVLLNVGYRDGLKKNYKMSVIRDGKEVGELKIVDVDEIISLAVPTSKDWRQSIGPKDKVLLKTEKSSGKKAKESTDTKK